MPVGRRVEQQARVLRRPGRQHDHARLLHLALLLRVVVLEAANAGSLAVGQHARDGRARPDFGARLARLGEVGDQRIAERAGRTADMAPAVVDAGRPAPVVGRVHPDCRGHHADAERFKALQPHLAIAEGLHRRHRIGLARRPPDLLGLGVAGDADVACDLVVVGRDVLVGDRPVERAVMLAADLEVVRKEARQVREIVKRGAADAPARLVAVAERILPFEKKRCAGRLDPSPPEVRADEIGELPIRPRLQDHHLPAGLCQHRGEHRARGARADDGDVYFLVRGHVTTSSGARCAACRECRAPRSHRACHTPRRRRRSAARSTRMRRPDPASLRSCSGASG